MTEKTNCPDCGVEVGMPHQSDCDVALCPVCGTQRITCNCPDLGKSIWTGDWPTSVRGCTSSVSNRKPKEASGYDFEPLPDGRFLLEFYGMDGFTFAEAIMERCQMESISEVIDVVLHHVDEHGVRKTNSFEQPEGYRKWLAGRRRQEMGLE